MRASEYDYSNQAKLLEKDQEFEMTEIFPERALNILGCATY